MDLVQRFWLRVNFNYSIWNCMRGRSRCFYLTCIEPKYLILYSQCSNSCGYGQKSRDIWCVDLSRSKVENGRCSSSSKPENVSSCFESKCPPKWKHGDWSAVSRIIYNLNFVSLLLVSEVARRHVAPAAQMNTLGGPRGVRSNPRNLKNNTGADLASESWQSYFRGV